MQFEFPGTIGVPDGRYLARDGSGGEQGQRVLVVETDGAPPPPRRRWRVKQAEPGATPAQLPLTRVTAVRAQEPFDSDANAHQWLEQTAADENLVDAAIDDAINLLNRAMHAQAIASVDPFGAELNAERAVVVRVGHGSGKEVASGRFAEAKAVETRTGGSRRRQRDEELRPQERLAAVLGSREDLDVCETLILRARGDLNAGRHREATLQLRVGLEAMLVELGGALADPDHERDMAELEGRRSEVGEVANAALRGSLSLEDEQRIEELLALSERVLRRRRVLRV